MERACVSRRLSSVSRDSSGANFAPSVLPLPLRARGSFSNLREYQRPELPLLYRT